MQPIPPKVEASWSQIQQTYANSTPEPVLNRPNFSLVCPNCKSRILIPDHQDGRVGRILPCDHVYCVRCLDGEGDGGGGRLGLEEPILKTKAPSHPEVEARQNLSGTWINKRLACCPKCNIPCFHLGCGCPIQGIRIPLLTPEGITSIPTTTKHGYPPVRMLCHECNINIKRHRLEQLLASLMPESTPQDNPDELLVLHRLPGYWNWVAFGTKRCERLTPQHEAASRQAMKVLMETYNITDHGASQTWSRPVDSAIVRFVENWDRIAYMAEWAPGFRPLLWVAQEGKDPESSHGSGVYNSSTGTECPDQAPPALHEPSQNSGLQPDIDLESGDQNHLQIKAKDQSPLFPPEILPEMQEFESLLEQGTGGEVRTPYLNIEPGFLQQVDYFTNAEEETFSSDEDNEISWYDPNDFPDLLCLDTYEFLPNNGTISQ